MLRRGPGKNGPLARNSHFRRPPPLLGEMHPHLLGEMQMSKEMPDHPQNARVRRRDRPRCGAKTRAGRACPVRVEHGKARCRFHGGLSTGPKTEAGRNRIAEAQRLRWLAYRENKLRQAPPSRASSAAPGRAHQLIMLRSPPRCRHGLAVAGFCTSSSGWSDQAFSARVLLPKVCARPIGLRSLGEAGRGGLNGPSRPAHLVCANPFFNA